MFAAAKLAELRALRLQDQIDDADEGRGASEVTVNGTPRTSPDEPQEKQSLVHRKPSIDGAETRVAMPSPESPSADSSAAAEAAARAANRSSREVALSNPCAFVAYTFRELRSLVSVGLFRHMASLAFLYFVNNQLSFVLLMTLDPATISLFKACSTILAAVMLWCCFARDILSLQWLALLMQIVGMLVVLYDPNRGLRGVAASLASYLLLILSVSITAVCSVWNEFVVKSYAANLMAQNVVLYALGTLYNVLYFAYGPDLYHADGHVHSHAELHGTLHVLSNATAMDAAPAWSDDSAPTSVGFFSGYSVLAVLVIVANSVMGLVITAVYKYADAVVKTFATACATAVLFVLNVLFFHLPLRVDAMLGVCIVFLASAVYFQAAIANQKAKAELEAVWMVAAPDIAAQRKQQAKEAAAIPPLSCMEPHQRHKLGTVLLVMMLLGVAVISAFSWARFQQDSMQLPDASIHTAEVPLPVTEMAPEDAVAARSSAVATAAATGASVPCPPSQSVPRCLWIILGESYRTGGQGVRNAGNPDMIPEQRLAMKSHVDVFQWLLDVHGVRSEVLMGQYSTPFDNDTLAHYGEWVRRAPGQEFPTTHWSAGMEGTQYFAPNSFWFNKHMQRVRNEWPGGLLQYEFVAFLRADVLLRPYFKKAFNRTVTQFLHDPDHAQMTMGSLLFTIYGLNHYQLPGRESAGWFPRVTDAYLFYPRRFLTVPQFWADDTAWAEYQQRGPFQQQDFWLMLNTLHDTDSAKCWNPCYELIGRPRTDQWQDQNLVFTRQPPQFVRPPTPAERAKFAEYNFPSHYPN